MEVVLGILAVLVFFGLIAIGLAVKVP